MNNNNNEVKQLLARILFHVAKVIPHEKLASDFLKIVLPTLVNGTKEKNVYVKANAEIALIAILRLKEGDTVFQVMKFIRNIRSLKLYACINFSEILLSSGRRSSRIFIRCCI